MSKETIYTLDVIHNGTDCGDICLYQTYDGQMDDIRPWSGSKRPHTRAP